MKNLLIVAVLLCGVSVVEGKEPRYKSPDALRYEALERWEQGNKEREKWASERPVSYVVDQRTSEDTEMALKNRTDNTLIIAGSVVLVGLFVSTALFLGLRPKKMTIARPIDRTE
jgi:hypothetical protein